MRPLFFPFALFAVLLVQACSPPPPAGVYIDLTRKTARYDEETVPYLDALKYLGGNGQSGLVFVYRDGESAGVGPRADHSNFFKALYRAEEVRAKSQESIEYAEEMIKSFEKLRSGLEDSEAGLEELEHD